jgi:hypothetical protein
MRENKELSDLGRITEAKSIRNAMGEVFRIAAIRIRELTGAKP